MFGLHGRDTFNKPTSNLGQIIRFVRKWWIKSFPYILTILIFIVIGVIAYVWHTYLYNIDVDDTQKQEYIDKKNKEVTFKKDKFDEMKSQIILRNKKFNEERIKYNDIFYIDVIGETEKE